MILSANKCGALGTNMIAYRNLSPEVGDVPPIITSAKPYDVTMIT